MCRSPRIVRSRWVVWSLSTKAADAPSKWGFRRLPAYGARRVPGLRREEVAVLAGVSVPYHTRLERGEINVVSEGVLGALAAALRLDEAETAHLYDLARVARPAPPRRARMSKQRVRPPVQHILDAITGAAAFVRNDRLDVLGGSQLGYALYSEMFVNPLRPVNTASGLTIFTYTPEPGSRDEKTLRLLGSWAATPGGSETASATGQELPNRSGAGTH